MVRSRRWFMQAGLVTTAGTALTLAARQRAFAQTRMTITTVAEFVRAIGPDRILEIAPGSFVLSEIPLGQLSPYVRVQEAFDGNELVISEVANLTLIGQDTILSRVLARPRYADVLKFENCRNLSLQNLEMAHTKDLGYCRGAVLGFTNCDTVEIDQCVLYGSGTYGIEGSNVSNLTCRETVIRDCTYGMLCFNNATNLQFESCQFFDNAGFSMINLNECQQITFSDCLLHDNITDAGFDLPYYLFHVWNSPGIELQNCRIYRNSVPYLASAEGAIALSSTTFEGNSFERDRYPAEPESFSPYCALP